MNRRLSAMNAEITDITYAFPKLEHVDPSVYIDAYNLILECSQAHSPRSFAIKLLDLMSKMCSYDEAMVFFLDVNKKISGKYTIHIQDKWLDEYMNYYLTQIEFPEEFRIYQDIRENTLNQSFSRIINWSEVPDSEFLTNYIKARKLKYSWGFCFFDLNGTYRAVFSLDRIRNEFFSKIEQDRLNLALPILNNMYRNFFYQGTDFNPHENQSGWSKYSFTKRETEIVNLLCQGMSIQNISSALYISKNTTYKHIAHIYEKAHVSTQQELLFKIMSQTEN